MLVPSYKPLTSVSQASLADTHMLTRTLLTRTRADTGLPQATLPEKGLETYMVSAYGSEGASEVLFIGGLVVIWQ